MAKKKKSPLYNTPYTTGIGSKIKKAYIKSNPSWQRSFGYDSEGNKIGASGDSGMPKTSGPKKLSPGGGVRRPTITSEGIKIPGTGPKPTKYERPGTGSTKVDKPKTTVKTKSNTSIKPKPAAKPITSSDSNKGTGYFNDKLSLGVDTKLNVAPMPKFEKTVTNARSADYDLVRAKGRGRTSRLKSRLARRQGRVENRVDRSLARIDARQQRQGTKYNAKMAGQDKGVNVGKMESQIKLDNFEKAINSPKATPRTSGAGNIPTSQPRQLTMPKSNQTVAKPSMKLNTSKQTAKVIDDSRIKQGAKKASGGGKVDADTYKSLTGFNKTTSKPGSSGGMQRGMTRTDQTKKLTNLASSNQPRKDVKNMSSKNYLTKGITPSYKNN